jgi:hypothetical protein
MLVYVYIWLSAQRCVSLTFIRLLLTFKGSEIPPTPSTKCFSKELLGAESFLREANSRLATRTLSVTCSHTSAPLRPILSHINPVFIHHFSEIQLNMSSVLRASSRSRPLGFPTKFFYTSHLFEVHCMTRSSYPPLI